MKKKMKVARARVELATYGYEPHMIPFHHLAIISSLSASFSSYRPPKKSRKGLPKNIST